MALRQNGEIVQLAESQADRAEQDDNFEVQGEASASLRLSELDQTTIAKYWRVAASGGTLLVQRAATVDADGEPATWTTWATFDPTGGTIDFAFPTDGARVSDTADFIAQLHAVLGLSGDDARLLALPQSGDTTSTTSSDKDARTVTYSATIAGFDTAGPIALGSGYYVDYNGTDEEADTPDVADLTFGDGLSDEPFSVIALVKPDANDAAMSLVAKENSAAAEEWALELNSSGHVVARLTDESATATLTATYASAIGTSWVLVGFSYDGSRANTGLNVWVDGAKQTVTRGGSGTYVAMEDTAALVHLASRYATKEQFFNGGMALAAVVARELRADEWWAAKTLVNKFYGLSL